MIEATGILLALILAGAAWSAWRVADGVARLVGGWPRAAGAPAGAVRARRLHAARAVASAQSAQLAAMSQELLRTRAMLRLAQRERDLLSAREGGMDDRFPRAKRAFALRFHPDRVLVRGLEGTLRRALFQEYWAVLQRIERN